MVREVRALITKRRCTDGDSLLGSRGRVVASIAVVVTGCDSEVHASINSLVDGVVECLRLATTERHVGDGALVVGLAGPPELLERSSGLRRSLLRRPHNTTDDVRHSATAVATEHLDSDHIRGLRDTVLARRDSTGTVGTVTVAVLINVVLGNGLAPRSATLELKVLDVDASVDDVDVDAAAPVGIVLVLRECTEGELSTVADTSKALITESVPSS